MSSNEMDNELDALWIAHTSPSDNEWDNWRRFGRAVARVEREAVLTACALDGITIKDLIRITQERAKA